MELQQNESGALDHQGGAGDGSQIDLSGDETQEEKLIKWDDHQRALEDLHKFKSSHKKLEKQLDDFKSKFKKQEEERLAKEENWKTLAEQRAEELNKTREQLDNYKSSFYTDKKYSAVETFALKAGIRNEAIEDLSRLDLDGVEIERTDQGRVIVHGAEEFIERLRKTRPFWFKSDKAPQINPGSSLSPIRDEDITPDYVVRLEHKYRRTRSPSDKEAWLSALNKFKKR